MNRRGFLQGLGAAAVAGAAGGAKADRSWSKDEFSQQFVGVMTSETFPGAMLTWKDENKDFFLNLREPTNFSMNNIEDKRLYYPKITSPKFQIKFGDDQPISGTGEIYTFPLRQLGDYTGFGMVLARGKTFVKWRDSFINADKVVMRLEIDGQQTTVVFHENPGLLQQRQTQRKQPILDKIYQEERAGDRVSGFDGIYSAVQLRGMLEPYKDQVPNQFSELDQEINALLSNAQGHQIAKDIEEQIKQDKSLRDLIKGNEKIKHMAVTDVETINKWLTSVYPKVIARLKKYNAMLSG